MANFYFYIKDLQTPQHPKSSVIILLSYSHDSLTCIYVLLQDSTWLQLS